MTQLFYADICCMYIYNTYRCRKDCAIHLHFHKPILHHDADNIQSATNLIKSDCTKTSLYLRNILLQSKSAGILRYVERKLYVIKHCTHLDDRQSTPADLYHVT